ncbi:50S ribosomal protein L11 methyltransferase [Candidatus Sumerlaeota bacterium]|nr:50S ribosomal protein L11 methyltransferase [Candidatus Sumerlaeota bacterium]
MSARGWLALTVRLHVDDRPRLEGLFTEWETLGLVEEDTGARNLEQITAHFSTGDVGQATLERMCRGELVSPPFAHRVDWRVEPLADQHWVEQAREFFTGIRICDRLSVLPPWAPDDHPLAGAPITLRIDPGMAFGTGTHESTRLMLGWLVDLVEGGGSVLDLGAGSAILSIAAARLGAGAIMAIEIDPEAEENARRNMALNGVSDSVEYRIGDFARESLEPADLVLCNTLVEIFEPHLERLRDLTRPGGDLLLAGLLVIDEAAVLEGLRAVGLEDTEVRREGEWSSIHVRRR